MSQVPGARRRRWAALMVAGVAAALLTTPASTPAAAHPGQPSAVFDPNEVGWAGERDYDVAGFDAQIARWSKKGFFLVDLEADSFGGQARYGGAWQYNTDGRGWWVDTVMTSIEYALKSAEMKNAGFRLVDREIYTRGTTRYYGAVWVANVENLGWDTQHDLTIDALDAYVTDQRKRGRMPIDFDMYRTSKGLRYGVVVLDNPENLDWQLHGDLPEVGFEFTFDAYGAAGYRMLSFDAGPGEKEQLFGGIWVENANGRQWRMRRHLNATNYANWWHKYADEGFRQIFVGRYESSGEIRYASIWRQNSDRFHWPYRSLVDNQIAVEMGEDSIPGLAVAVMQGGQFQYVKGFGDADIDGGIWMDSAHVLRTASVSKAIGGVLALRMEEQGVVDRNDPLSLHVDDTPAQHTSTLEELFSNRGCVRHYAKADSPEALADPDEYEAQEAADAHLESTEFNSAYGAALHFRDDPLLLNCTIGDDKRYSTHGVVLGSSGLQQAADVAIHDLVRQQISDPLGLTTLRAEDPDDTNARRAKIYVGENNTEATRDHVTWKVLGGGLESDIRDLATFGHAVLAGQVISPLNVEYMWSGTGWDYAYGWGQLSDDSGHRRVGKSGGGLGADSYLLMYPDDDLVIAVMANREELDESDNNAKNIATYIGGLIF